MHTNHPCDGDDALLQVRASLGDPVAEAWLWIKAYADSLSGEYDDFEYTVYPDELIDTAMSHVESESQWGGDYLVKGGLLEGKDVDPLFWDKLAILKEIEIPQSNRSSFFDCSC